MNNLYITLPKKWGDIAPDLLPRIAALFLDEIDRSTFLIKVFSMITGIRPVLKDPVDKSFWFSKDKGDPFLITTESLAELTRKMEFLLEPVDDCQVPVWKGSTKYLAPKQRLYNLTVEQYLYAELAFAAYELSKDDEYLCKLMAALWVPKDGIRADRIPEEAKKFQKISRSILMAVFLFYAGARRFLAREFPHIFKEGDSGDDEDVTALIRSLNGGDVTKNEAILKIQLWDALKQLEDMAIQVETLKSRST